MHIAAVNPLAVSETEIPADAIEKERHKDAYIVEMLAGDALVIGDDDVARLEAGPAIARDGVADDDAKVGHEVRHAADILRDQLPIGVKRCSATQAE